jgi:hypothetical protein
MKRWNMRRIDRKKRKMRMTTGREPKWGGLEKKKDEKGMCLTAGQKGRDGA